MQNKNFVIRLTFATKESKKSSKHKKNWGKSRENHPPWVKMPPYFKVSDEPPFTPKGKTSKNWSNLQPMSQGCVKLSSHENCHRRRRIVLHCAVSSAYTVHCTVCSFRDNPLKITRVCVCVYSHVLSLYYLISHTWHERHTHRVLMLVAILMSFIMKLHFLRELMFLFFRFCSGCFEKDFIIIRG